MTIEPESEFELREPVDEEDASAPRVLRPRRAAPADAIRPTRAEINLAHLRHNLHVVARWIGRGAARAPAADGPKIWAVLKADAYGHGAPAVARTLERAGLDGICVALLEEALELRAAGIRIPILVMGGYYGPHHRGLEEVIESELVPVLYHPEQIDRLGRIVEGRGSAPAAFHLKVDTGMARLGVRPDELPSLLDRLDGARGVLLEGVMSHLACADANDPHPTRAQLARFRDVCSLLDRRGRVPAMAHLANSAAAFAFPETRFDAVRPGLALYGVSPFAADHPREDVRALAAELRPVMRVRTEIVALRDIEPGDSVGYGQTYVARGPRRIATVPMGYADGLDRALSNRGVALVRGKRTPIAGVVSMDLTTLDVTDVPGVSLGDEVVVLGSQDGPLGSGTIHATELAELVGAIPWEIVTSISRRVPRFFREP
jgi:alanine racemase